MKGYKNRLRRTLGYIGMGILAFIMLFPFYVLCYVALNNRSNPLSQGVFAMPDITAENFITAWQRGNLGGAAWNSFLITAGCLVLIVLLGASAGYTIARYSNTMNKIIFSIFLCCMMVPGIINTVPLYSIMRRIHGINTHWAMILLLSANRLPYCVFLYKQFVESMPRDLEEAATLDGCSRFQAYWLVTFPLMKPVTSTVVIISSVSFWNNYSQAVFFLQEKSLYTLPLSMKQFVLENTKNWNSISAAALISAVPMVILFLCLQKYFIKGLAAGAVKG